MNLKVTYLNEEELENFRAGIETIYDIIAESKSYPIIGSKSKNKYFELRIKQDKLEQIKTMIKADEESA